jgi:endonuclease/exonuclease/phosphatase family metal-dependent hydrolase
MQIRLGTLNAWALPEPVARDTEHRIDAIGKKLQDYDLDVIAFQEVWTSAARATLQRAGKRAGLVHSWGGKNSGWSLARESGGLLILSRLPIEGVAFESFVLRGEPERAVANLEYVSGKGFVAVELRTPEGPFALINTHLHARYKTRPHNYVPHRTGQAIQLAARYAKSEMPMVVVGDFNFREGEPDYLVLRGLLGVRDAAVELDQRQDTTLTSNPYRKSRFSRRKDYVFVRDGASLGLATRRIDRAFDAPLEIDGHAAAYSNHAGLIVEFELGGTGARAQSGGDPSIIQLAADLLDVGKQLAKQRRQGERQLSGLGVGYAALAGLAMLPERVSRRRMLRMSLGASALAALTPGVGFSVISEVLVQDEITAFKQAAEQLAQLDRERLV